MNIERNSSCRGARQMIPTVKVVNIRINEDTGKADRILVRVYQDDEDDNGIPIKNLVGTYYMHQEENVFVFDPKSANRIHKQIPESNIVGPAERAVLERCPR